MKHHTNVCEDAIARREPQAVVDNTSAIARLANRVIMIAKQEADNSEDPHFVRKLNSATNNLQMCKKVYIYLTCSSSPPIKEAE